MACSVDISASGTSSVLEEQCGAGYARECDDYQIKYETYYMPIDEERIVKSAEDLRKELKKAEKAERKKKAANRKADEQQARALKNLERLAKGDDDAAFDAARYLYENANQVW